MGAFVTITGHPLASARVSTADDILGPDVVDALRQGERWAWERAYGAYARPLTSYLSFRLDGQATAVTEALSATFVRAVESCAHLRGGGQRLPVQLFQIARRVADDVAPPAEQAGGISVADREVLVLRLCAGLSCADVAKVVGKRAATVRVQQLRALEALAAGADTA